MQRQQDEKLKNKTVKIKVKQSQKKETAISKWLPASVERVTSPPKRIEDPKVCHWLKRSYIQIECISLSIVESRTWVGMSSEGK